MQSCAPPLHLLGWKGSDFDNLNLLPELFSLHEAQKLWRQQAFGLHLTWVALFNFCLELEWVKDVIYILLDKENNHFCCITDRSKVLKGLVIFISFYPICLQLDEIRKKITQPFSTIDISAIQQNDCFLCQAKCVLWSWVAANLNPLYLLSSCRVAFSFSIIEISIFISFDLTLMLCKLYVPKQQNLTC